MVRTVRAALLPVLVAALVGALPGSGHEAFGQDQPPAPPTPAAPAPGRPPRTVGQRIYPRLAPVRENLAVLGTPICVFVGYFPAGDDAWVRELCYDRAVVQLGVRVTFVRHQRRAVRDLDETFLRAAGLPRPQAWEGLLVLDRDGGAVGRLPTPVRPERLVRLLREALERGAGARSAVVQNARTPRFHLSLGEGVDLDDLAPDGWDLSVSVADAGGGPIRVRIRSERIGPTGRRGERMVMREVAQRRFLRDRLGKDVQESAPEHPEGAAVLWSFRLREPEKGIRARAEVLLRWDGDLVTAEAASGTRTPRALRAAVWRAAIRLRPGPAPKP